MLPERRKARTGGAGGEAFRGSTPGERTPTRFLCYRITNYRPDAYPDLKLTGREAGHDLRLFVEDLSDAANVPAAAAGEPVLTVETLAKKFHVSTKTISRWRRLGLVSRRFVMDGRKRVGFLASSVDRFVEQNTDRVRRGGQFSQLSEDERTMILRRARAGPGGRQPGGGHPPVGPQDRPQPGNHPLHLEAIRPGPSRLGDLPGESRAAAIGDEAEDLPAIPLRRIG